MSAATPKFKKDDLVIINPDYATASTRGMVYRIIGFLKVNVRMVPLNGGNPVSINPEVLLPASAAAIAAAAELPYLAPMDPGAVVTVAGHGWKASEEDLYVVLKENSNGKISVAKLGGDEGKWFKVPRGYLTLVDAARIHVAPAA